MGLHWAVDARLGEWEEPQPTFCLEQGFTPRGKPSDLRRTAAVIVTGGITELTVQLAVAFLISPE